MFIFVIAMCARRICYMYVYCDYLVRCVYAGAEVNEYQPPGGGFAGLSGRVTGFTVTFPSCGLVAAYFFIEFVSSLSTCFTYLSTWFTLSYRLIPSSHSCACDTRRRWLG